MPCCGARSRASCRGWWRAPDAGDWIRRPDAAPARGWRGVRRRRAVRGAEGPAPLRLDPSTLPTARITDWRWPRATPPGGSSSSPTCPSCCRSTARRASGRVMLDVVNRGNTVAVPNFNRATRPVFVPGAGSQPAHRRRRRLPDAPRLRGDLVRLAGATCPRCPGLFRPARARGARRAGQPLRGRVYTQLQSPGAVRAFPALRSRPPAPTPPPISTSPTRSCGPRPARRPGATTIPRERWRFARAAGGTHRPRCASHLARGRLRERAASTRSATRRSARPCIGLVHRRAARQRRPGSSTATAPRAIRRPARSAGRTPTAARRPDACCARSSTRI